MYLKEENSDYIDQNMTDIALSVLGIILLIFAVVTIFYKTTTSGDFEERIERRKQLQGEKWKIIDEVNKGIKNLTEIGLSLEEYTSFIDRITDKEERKQQNLDNLEETLFSQRDEYKLLSDISILIQEKEKIISDNLNKIEIIKKSKEKVVTIEGNGRKSGWRRNTSGRLYFIYSCYNQEVFFDGEKVSRDEFEGIVSWFTRESVSIVAKLEKNISPPPYWINDVFNQYNWKPTDIELK